MMIIFLLGLGFVAFEVFHKTPASPKQFPRTLSPKRFLVRFTHQDPTNPGSSQEINQLETDDLAEANKSFDDTLAQLRASGLAGQAVVLFDQNLGKTIRAEGV